ncbi:MAG: hypothetical protein ACRCZS_01810 [Chroococcidiopsis sp.]
MAELETYQQAQRSLRQGNWAVRSLSARAGEDFAAVESEQLASISIDFSYVKEAIASLTTDIAKFRITIFPILQAAITTLALNAALYSPYGIALAARKLVQLVISVNSAE